MSEFEDRYSAGEIIHIGDRVTIDHSRLTVSKCSPAIRHDGIALNSSMPGYGVGVRLVTHPPEPPREMAVPIVSLNHDLVAYGSSMPETEYQNSVANDLEDRMRAEMVERITEEVHRKVAASLGLNPAAFGIVDSGFAPPPPFEFAPPPGQRRFA